MRRIMRKKLASFMNSKYILIGLSALCLLFIATSFFTDKLTTPLRNAISTVVIPVQRGMNYIGLWISDKYDTLQEISTVLEENKDLQAKVDDLTEENNQLKQDSYELDRLRDLYELDEKYPGYNKVAARVVGTTSGNWYSTFTIDKGSNDGIEKDMNVIAGGGLVGIITEVGPNYAQIKTVIEDNSYVSGMLIDTGDTCIVKGDIELMDTGLIHLSGFANSVKVIIHTPLSFKEPLDFWRDPFLYLKTLPGSKGFLWRTFGYFKSISRIHTNFKKCNNRNDYNQD